MSANRADVMRTGTSAGLLLKSSRAAYYVASMEEIFMTILFVWPPAGINDLFAYTNSFNILNQLSSGLSWDSSRRDGTDRQQRDQRSNNNQSNFFLSLFFLHFVFTSQQ